MPTAGQRRSKAQEKRVANRTGGTLNAGSGSGWRRRHDIRDGRFLWEMKTTDRPKRQITVKADDLDSVRKVSYLEGRIPVMGIEVGGRNYVILQEDDFLEMVED